MIAYRHPAVNDTNILSRIPSELIAELPEAASSPDDSLRVRVRLPDGTRAEVVFVKLRSKKGKTTRWFWTLDSATLNEGWTGTC